LDRPERTLRGKLYQLLLREPTWLDCGALTEERMAHFHAELWRQRPKIVQAYARSAVLFARWLEANRLQPHRPESIITSAEVLEDEDRALLERVFGSRVYNRYGCREFSVVASECSHGGMHVMAESLYVEVENGALLVTDLLNEAMPMIRYRIGDMGEWATGECACGRKLPRLKKIAGRVTDFLVGSDGRMVSGVFLATYVVAHRPSLGQVQIVQDRAGHVLYRLCPGPRFDSICDAEYLRQATQQHLGNAATMEMEIVNEIPRAASGKFVFSRSSVVPNYVRAG
jgi:phenylacetate-CoA ligase